jgi:gliding motility-associated-like protein
MAIQADLAGLNRKFVASMMISRQFFSKKLYLGYPVPSPKTQNHTLMKVATTISKLLLLSFLGGWITTSSLQAQNQCCQPLENAEPGISYTFILSDGTNASGVAYNPNFDLYYALIAGNPDYPLETFAPDGTPLFQTETGFDSRGLWWNPNLGQLEANGFNAFGLHRFDLDANGFALNTGVDVFTGMNQPDMQSCGDLDYDANEILYYDDGMIYRYDREDNSFLGSYALTGIPVPLTDINSTTVIYTGCPEHEIGILDYVNKRVYFFDKSDGSFTFTSQLPEITVTNNSFRFSFANNHVWLYDVATRSWSSFRVFDETLVLTEGLGDELSLCEGDTTILDITTANASYKWQDGSTESTFTVTEEGVYSVTVTVDDCSVGDSVLVNYFPLPVVQLPGDTAVCEGDSVLLSAETPGGEYLWQNGSINSQFIAGEEGLYFVEVMVNNCAASDTFRLSFIQDPPPMVDLGMDTLICEGDGLELDAEVGQEASYLWQDGSVGSLFTVDTAGTYFVTASTACFSDSDTLEVMQEKCDCIVEVPNIFTPNNDGTNDVFQPVIDCDLTSYQLLVFNRWGEQVFESRDPLVGWNGEYKDKPLPSDAYVYVLNYESEDEIRTVRKEGDFSLFR